MTTIATTTPLDEIRRIVRTLASENASGNMSLEETREAFDRRGASVPLPEGVELSAVQISDALVGERLQPAEGKGGIILYLHGGAFCTGSAMSHRPLAARLAAASGWTVLSLDYRLAPEHRFPAALDDAYIAYRWLLEQGYRPAQTVVAGDSAGGGLAMALLQKLLLEGVEDGLPMPGGAVGLSPWLDLRCTSASYDENGAIDLLATAAGLRFVGAGYVGKHSPTDVLASPYYASSFEGICPLLLQVGGKETLLDEVQHFARAAEQDGAAVTLQVWENMTHVWHSLEDVLPEADRAIEAVARWLDESVRV